MASLEPNGKYWMNKKTKLSNVEALMKKVLIISYLILTLSNLSFAFYLTGNQLVEYMKEWEKNQKGESGAIFFKDGFFCGFTKGITDALDGYLFQIPENATQLQIDSVIVKYLNDNPDKWNKLASTLVIEALANAFPKIE